MTVIGILSLGLVSAHAADKKADAKAKTTVLKNVSGSVNWTGYGVGKSHAGTIAIKSGEVTMQNDKPTSAHFILDMKSLDTKDSEKLKGHLRSADFFEVDKYPEAHFKTTSMTEVAFVKASDPTYAVKGDLTIKDKTHPIEFELVVTKKGGAYVGKASTQIPDRTKYGIVYNSKQHSTVSKLGDKLIEDNIKLDIEATVK